MIGFLTKAMAVTTEAIGGVFTLGNAGVSPQKRSSAAFDPKIDDGIKKIFQNVDPGLVLQCYDRFGRPALQELGALTQANWDKLPTSVAGTVQVFVNLESILAGVQTILLKFLPLLADQMQGLLSDEKAKENFASDLAQNIETSVGQISQVLENLHAESIDLLDPSFIQKFDELLLQTPAMKAMGTKEEFYARLAPKLLTYLKTNIDMPSWLKVVDAAHTTLQPNVQINMVQKLLLATHNQVTDPTFLKDMLGDLILNNCGEAMEEHYAEYLEHLEMPVDTAPKYQHHNAYGKAIMGLIHGLNPSILGLSVVRHYKTFNEHNFKAGTDQLSTLLRDLVGKKINSKMQPHTDKWMVGIIHLMASKMLSSNGQLVQCPTHVPMDTWNAMNVEDQKKVCDPATELGKYWEARRVEKIDRNFVLSCQRLGRGVLNAGLVFEQFLLTARQVMADPTKAWHVRGFAAIFAFFLGLFPCSIIFEGFHRLLIWIRAWIADKIGNRAGLDLAQRCDVFLKTKAFDLVVMQLVEHLLNVLNTSDVSKDAVVANLFPNPSTNPIKA